MILYDGTYRMKNVTSEALSFIANFLTDDVQYIGFESYKSWINDSNQQTVSCNRSFLDKFEGMIYIRDLYDEDCGILEDRFLVVSPENLLEIIDHWEKFCKTKPAQITIIMDENGYIQLLPSNT